MFTVMFAIPRTSGWIAQWLEMVTDDETKIARPRQIYTGAREQDYVDDRRAREADRQADRRDQPDRPAAQVAETPVLASRRSPFPPRKLDRVFKKPARWPPRRPPSPPPGRRPSSTGRDRQDRRDRTRQPARRGRRPRRRRLRRERRPGRQLCQGKGEDSSASARPAGSSRSRTAARSDRRRGPVLGRERRRRVRHGRARRLGGSGRQGLRRQTSGTPKDIERAAVGAHAGRPPVRRDQGALAASRRSTLSSGTRTSTRSRATATPTPTRCSRWPTGRSSSTPAPTRCSRSRQQGQPAGGDPEERQGAAGADLDRAGSRRRLLRRRAGRGRRQGQGACVADPRGRRHARGGTPPASRRITGVAFGPTAACS